VTAGQLLAELASRGVHLWKEGDRLRYSAPQADALDNNLIEMIRSRRTEILDLLGSVGLAAAPPRPIVKAPEGAVVRCSSAQERFLFTAELEEISATYNLSTAFRIIGDLDVAALDLSLRDLVRRHPVLRSRFEARSEGFVIVPSGWEPALEIADCAGSQDDLASAIERERARPFDVAQGPHLRTKLFREAPDRHMLLVTIHHIVSDGGSIGIFAQELQALYAWRIGNTATPPPEPEFQFLDFAYSERTDLDNGIAGQHLEFWRRQLEGSPALLALPTDRPRPAVRARAGGSVPIELDPPLQRRLDAARGDRRLSRFQLVASAFWLLLHKYSSERSIVIGTPWRNRTRPGSVGIIGPLLNLLPICVRLDPNVTVGHLLESIKTQTAAAIANSNVPFEQIVSLVRPERSPGYTPIFQAICAIEDTPRNVVELPGVKIEQVDLPDEAARYDLALVLHQDGNTLRGALKYDRSLFDASTAARMARHFISALRIVLGDPALPIARANLLSEEERKLQIVEWGRKERPYALHKTIVDLFEEAVERSPDRTAVEFGERTLTYRELDQWSNQVAHRLGAAGIARDDFVAITLERSLEMIVSVLGVLKAGAAYVPIDSDFPQERRAWMIDDAGVRAVIGPDGGSDGALLQLQRDDILVRSAAPDCRNSSSPDSACYVMYTSGSTGQPKGAITDHRAIANNLLWMNDEWPLTHEDAVLFKSSPSFDVSVKEIMWPLIAGARLVVARPGRQRDPEYLREIIRSRRITVVHMVPSMLDYFLRHESAGDLPYLRIVMCGGEALHPALRKRFHKAFGAILLHLYGPTEAAIAVTGYAISSEHADVERLPLGRPMPNCQIYIVDDALEPVPVGTPGELCIAGVPLARGYLGRPDLTAEKFVPDPFGASAGSRMYRTGDLARWREDGQIEYVGRIDRQVKVRGFRVEPGEIEAAIRAQAGVEEALVVTGASDGPSPLVAYIVPQRSGISTEKIQQALRARFPAFMVPGSFVVVPAFPLGVNGKVDLAALPPARGMPERRGGEPPRGEIECRVSEVWCRILNVDSVGRDESFFDLGGHSLLLLRLRDELQAELGYSISVADLLLRPTVTSFAAHLSDSTLRRTGKWMKRRISDLGIGFGN
jgi:amino acid adenylation domain-containing protein